MGEILKSYMNSHTIERKHKKINQDIRKESQVSFVIASPWSGSGKTMISCGLMQLFLNRGCRVRAFKCGPDYIDPMFHRQVIGVSSRNLDTFFSNEEQIRHLYAQHSASDCESVPDKVSDCASVPDPASVSGSASDSRSDEVTVIEGVMGLYDGLGGVRKEGASYHLAQVLNLPILLVADAHGMGRTLQALLAGILQYDTDHRIAGIVLNRINSSYGSRLTPLLEEELRLPVLGIIPDTPELRLESRHLGLILPQEQLRLRERLNQFAELLEKNMDIERMKEEIQAAQARSRIDKEPSDDCNNDLLRNEMPDCRIKQRGISLIIKKGQKIRIAVAYDEAFCFYYEDNLQILREAGAELIFFSPICDHRLPEAINGLLLGGGYPELHLTELAENKSMREAIRRAIERRIPSVAECGGFLYLHDHIRDRDGREYPMAGILQAEVQDEGKLVRFGYVELRERIPNFLQEGTTIRGHEFHYYESGDNGADCEALKPVTGQTWNCIHTAEEHWWGFPHLYYPSNPSFAENFVEKCRAAVQSTE